MHVYPNPDSWGEFYPSEIFVNMTEDDDPVPILKMVNIGATIVVGIGQSASTTFKKVGDIEAIADLETSLVILGKVGGSNG